MPKKPNIILILDDHQAFYGHEQVKRPNFDRLAAEGINFNRAYSACPLCGPARRSLLTGLFPHAHKEIRNDVKHPFKYDTYLDVLARNGYKNYYYGKWHAGPGTALDHKCQGFTDEDYGNPYNKPEYREYLKKHNLPEFKVKIEEQLTRWPISLLCRYKKGKEITPNKLGHSGWATGTVTTPTDTHEAFFLANLACEKLEELVKSGNKKPFHLRIDFWGPHQPYWTTQEFLDLYNPKDIQKHPSFDDDMDDKPEIYKKKNWLGREGFMYPRKAPWSFWQKILHYTYAQQSLIDAAAGKVIDKVDELGLKNETIIIWSADHGDAIASHGGLFDKDAFMSEEVVRIPLVVRHPESDAPRKVENSIINSLDIPATILDLAQTRFEHKIHGSSLKPILDGEETDERTETMSQTHGHFHNHLGRMIVTQRYKYIWNARDIDELYDLKDDPFELTNLVNNVEYKLILQELKEKLKNLRETVNDRVKWKDVKFLRNKLMG